MPDASGAGSLTRDVRYEEDALGRLRSDSCTARVYWWVLRYDVPDGPWRRVSGGHTRRHCWRAYRRCMFPGRAGASREFFPNGPHPAEIGRHPERGVRRLTPGASVLLAVVNS